MSEMSRNALDQSLASVGADLSKWPSERASLARKTLLSDPAFRRAWERARDLDGELGVLRDELDRGVRDSGALDRVRHRALARLPGPLAGVAWRRIAAAMVVAGMLGGALDLVLPEQPIESAEVVMLDPLYGLASAELQ